MTAAVARHLLIALGLASTLFLGGCSWLFVTEAPSHHARLPYFDCTSGKAAPVLDTVAAVAYGLEAAVIAGGGLDYGVDYSDNADRSVPVGLVVASLAVAVAGAASAVYGYNATSECADAKEALALRMLNQPPERVLTPVPVSCASDVQCKGARICVAGECVFEADVPRPLPAPLPEEPPAPAPPPSASPPPTPADAPLAAP